MREIDWYFDALSPFAYLQFKLLQRQGLLDRLTLRPILFAALLEHWGHVGPAEMPTKRVFTYEHCAWLAHRHQIAMTLPAEHPFNPLPLLRLAAACQKGRGLPQEIAAKIFDFVWLHGHLPSEQDRFTALLADCETDAARLADPSVKSVLRTNGDEAIAAGVFGVPTTVVDGQLLWGVDSTDMLVAWMAGDPFFQSDQFLAASRVRAGLQRPARPR